MLSKLSIVLVILLTAFSNANAQFSNNDHWYSNPLGFKPLELHASMGFVVPAVAVVACLLLTKKNTALKKGFLFFFGLTHKIK